jgi:hypothetical protein
MLHERMLATQSTLVRQSLLKGSEKIGNTTILSKSSNSWRYLCQPVEGLDVVQITKVDVEVVSTEEQCTTYPL